MRYAKWFILAIILCLASIWLYFMFIPYSKINPLKIIPGDAIYILETEKPIEQWTNFSSSNFWKFLSKQSSLEELANDARYLDSLISSNKSLLKHFGDRHFIMSAHMTKSNDYDFLFAFDLRRVSKLNIATILSASLNDSEFQVEEVDYKTHTIIKVTDLHDSEILYITQIDNYLTCTYSHIVMHQCIDHLLATKLSDNQGFQTAYKQTTRNGMGQFYLNYKYLDEFSSVYLLNNSGLSEQLESEFEFTGLDLSLSENALKLEGFTTIAASESYMRILQQHGNSRPTYQNVLSARTAYAQSIHLDDANGFYRDLIDLRSRQSGDVAEFKKLKLKFEKTLQLKLEDDFLSWIGEEIVVAQNVANRTDLNEDNLVVAIKVNNLNNAQSKLALIQKQVKKRTPAKFKQLSYKSHTIHYLDLKGVFNLFFGKTFNKITKPYYTVIDEYVLFSNSPKTLVALIEDYENGQTLSNTKLFQTALKEMPKELSLFTFINTELLYPVLNQYVKTNQKADYHKNQKYFQFFKSLSIGFKSKGANFSNHVYCSFSQESISEPLYSSIAIDSIYNTYIIGDGSVEGLSDAELFNLEHFEKGRYSLYYPDGKTLKISAKVKNGLLHGSYEEFYRNSNIKIKGKYRKGKKTGLWKYYSIDGKVNERKWE